MIVSVTCIECVKKYSTSVPEEAIDQYLNGISPELAFALVSVNARNLVVDKMCPKCWAATMADPAKTVDPAEGDDNGWYKS